MTAKRMNSLRSCNSSTDTIHSCTMHRISMYDEEDVSGIECSECRWSEVWDEEKPLPDECPFCHCIVEKE